MRTRDLISPYIPPYCAHTLCTVLRLTVTIICSYEINHKLFAGHGAVSSHLHSNRVYAANFPVPANGGSCYTAAMSRSIEVEMKFEILDYDSIRHFLDTLLCTGEQHVIDSYLDTPDGSLFKRGIFIRVRNGTKLDIKFNPEDIAKSRDESIDHLYCDEVTNALPLSRAMLPDLNKTLIFLGLNTLDRPSYADFTAANGFAESMTIDKRRRSYAGGDFHIDIDDVKNLGKFLEIEKMTDEHADPERIRAEMNRFLDGLQLRYIDTGYNELYWRKHDFELYLQGKYLLPEDRKKYRTGSIAV